MTSRPTGHEPSGLSPSVERLVASERTLEPQTEAVRARLLSRAREALELGAVPPEASRTTRCSSSVSYRLRPLKNVVICGARDVSVMR